MRCHSPLFTNFKAVVVGNDFSPPLTADIIHHRRSFGLLVMVVNNVGHHISAFTGIRMLSTAVIEREGVFAKHMRISILWPMSWRLTTKQQTIKEVETFKATIGRTNAHFAICSAFTYAALQWNFFLQGEAENKNQTLYRFALNHLWQHCGNWDPCPPNMFRLSSGYFSAGWGRGGGGGSPFSTS